MIITTASNNHKYFDNHHYDYNYIDNLKFLLKSINIFHPEEQVIIYLINYTNKNDGEFTNIHPNIKIKHINKNGSNIEIRNFSAHLRAQALLENFNKDVPHILWLDVDIIIRRSISNLLKISTQIPTIKILVRRGNAHNCRFQSAVFALNNTVTTKKMLKWWADYIETNDKTNNIDGWFADQHGLYLGCLKFNINVSQLSEQYNDSTFKPTSTIWHCKGKYKNYLWIRECYAIQRYKN